MNFQNNSHWTHHLDIRRFFQSEGCTQETRGGFLLDIASWRLQRRLRLKISETSRSTPPSNWVLPQDPPSHFRRVRLYPVTKVTLDFASSLKSCPASPACPAHHSLPWPLPSHPASLLSSHLLGGTAHCIHRSSSCPPLPSTVPLGRGIQFLFFSVLQALYSLLCPLRPSLCHVPKRLRSKNWANGLLSTWASAGFTSWMLGQEAGGLPLLNRYRPASLQLKPWLLRRLSRNSSSLSPELLGPPSHFRLKR